VDRLVLAIRGSLAFCRCSRTPRNLGTAPGGRWLVLVSPLVRSSKSVCIFLPGCDHGLDVLIVLVVRDELLLGGSDELRRWFVIDVALGGFLGVRLGLGGWQQRRELEGGMAVGSARGIGDHLGGGPPVRDHHAGLGSGNGGSGACSALLCRRRKGEDRPGLLGNGGDDVRCHRRGDHYLLESLGVVAKGLDHALLLLLFPVRGGVPEAGLVVDLRWRALPEEKRGRGVVELLGGSSGGREGEEEGGEFVDGLGVVSVTGVPSGKNLVSGERDGAVARLVDDAGGGQRGQGRVLSVRGNHHHRR